MVSGGGRFCEPLRLGVRLPASGLPISIAVDRIKASSSKCRFRQRDVSPSKVERWLLSQCLVACIVSNRASPSRTDGSRQDLGKRQRHQRSPMASFQRFRFPHTGSQHPQARASSSAPRMCGLRCAAGRYESLGWRLTSDCSQSEILIMPRPMGFVSMTILASTSVVFRMLRYCLRSGIMAMMYSTLTTTA